MRGAQSGRPAPRRGPPIELHADEESRLVQPLLRAGGRLLRPGVRQLRRATVRRARTQLRRVVPGERRVQGLHHRLRQQARVERREPQSTGQPDLHAELCGRHAVERDTATVRAHQHLLDASAEPAEPVPRGLAHRLLHLQVLQQRAEPDRARRGRHRTGLHLRQCRLRPLRQGHQDLQARLYLDGRGASVQV